MKPQIEKGNGFSQKRVNHIFHYTGTVQSLKAILEKGFIPSYCLETINNWALYVPMVSFCNIPIGDVEYYMHYGRFGIGMSLEWAVRNGVSPVVYIHENTPFGRFHDMIVREHDIRMSARRRRQFMLNPDLPPYDVSDDLAFMRVATSITTIALQFFKNWKTEYKGQEIVTYLEREWRYVPQVEEHERLVTAYQSMDEVMMSRPKPHLPEHALNISELSDLRYIVIESDEYRSLVFEALTAKFGSEKVMRALADGELSVLTTAQVWNDF